MKLKPYQQEALDQLEKEGHMLPFFVRLSHYEAKYGTPNMVVIPPGMEVVPQYEMDRLLERQVRAKIKWRRMLRDNLPMWVRYVDYTLCHCGVRR